MAGTRKTVGKSPLAGLVSKPDRREIESKGEEGSKARVNTTISPLLLERLRNAAYWTPGESVSSIVERGIEREIERMEKANGGSFEPRRGKLRTGRQT